MLLAHESPRHNLKLLWWLRNIAIAGQSVTVAFVSLSLKLPLPLTPLILIIASLAAVNCVTYLRLKHLAPVTQTEFFIQLLIDMVGLTGLLYFTGGAGNPFTSLFILQVVIAAIALPVRACWLVALTAIAFYTFLMLYKVDVPSLSHVHGGDFFSLHVQGMWINFLLLSVLVAWFVTRISATLRRQDQLLLEAEQLAILGTFATQAAHDLGTPLATMAILAETLREQAKSPEEHQRAETLAGQIERCKEGISKIAASAGVMRAESGKPVPLDRYLQEIADHFRVLRPEAQLVVDISGTMPAPVISTRMGLEQAIANLLSNAADASPGFVQFHACWTAHSVTLTVTDKGPGIGPAIVQSLGAPGVTTKPAGLGMGLYLTKTVVMQLGGGLRAERLAAGGTRMHVTFPFTKLAS